MPIKAATNARKTTKPASRLGFTELTLLHHPQIQKLDSRALAYSLLTCTEELPFQQTADRVRRPHFQSYRAKRRAFVPPHQVLAL